MAGEKTEKATPKRKQDERKKGNVFVSKEVVSVSSLLLMFLALKFLLPTSITYITNFVIEYFAVAGDMSYLSDTVISSVFVDSAILFGLTALPLLMISILISVVATMAQTKMLFSAKAFAFKGDRINPISGFKRMFSLRGFVELIKSMLKIGLLLYIIFLVLSNELVNMPKMFNIQPIQAYAYTGEVIFTIAISVGVIFIFLAGLDYLYQWWNYEKQLRMTKQEIKDEYKQVEGDPQIKAHIRALQQQRARQRMMQNVPSADVVIRNPTHYAIAIKYDAEKNNAPVVIAKGADFIALKIIEVADENDVYITENKPLARALYDTVELYSEIPPEHYQAIAEILGFIYNLKKNRLRKA